METLSDYKREKQNLKPLVKKWFKNGMSKAEIARMICRDEKTVRVWLKEDTEKLLREERDKIKRMSIKQKIDIIRMLDSGFTIQEICKSLLVEREVVIGIRKKLK